MRRLAFILLSIICILATVGCGKTQPISKYDFCLDTICTITIYDSSDKELPDRCFSLIRDYEALLSATVTDSDIYRINHAHGEKVEISDDTVFLLKEAIRYGDLTDGAFDITIYPVSSVWDFKSGKSELPDETELGEALEHVDYKNIVLEGNTVYLKDPEAGLELGALAKGYIADKTAEFLREEGVTSALINLGGNVAAIGSMIDGSDFRIGVKKPFETDGDALKILNIRDASVATSGIDERYFEYGGRYYYHILDPKTGYPVRSGLNQVSVTAPSAMEADILSTVLFVLGSEEGKKFLNRDEFKDVSAIFVDTENMIIQ